MHELEDRITHAYSIRVDSSGFYNNLSLDDDTTQKALETLDALIVGGTPPASAVTVITTNFNNNLSAADSDVQHAMETLDDLVIPTGFAGSAITLNTATFDENLSAADSDVQHAMETLDDLVIPAGGDLLVANTLFVDSVNGDDGTGTRGNASLPYETIQAAVDDANDGDVVVIRPGTYAEAVDLGDVTGITLMAEASDTVYITGAVDTDTISRVDVAEMGTVALRNLVVTNGSAGYKCLAIDCSTSAGSANSVILDNVRMEADSSTEIAAELRCLESTYLDNIYFSGDYVENEVGVSEIHYIESESDILQDFDTTETLPTGYSEGTFYLENIRCETIGITKRLSGTVETSTIQKQILWEPDHTVTPTLNLNNSRVISGSGGGTDSVECTMNGSAGTAVFNARACTIEYGETMDHVIGYHYMCYIIGTKHYDTNDCYIYGGTTGTGTSGFVNGAELHFEYGDGQVATYPVV